MGSDLSVRTDVEECLDHILPLNEGQVPIVVAESVTHYKQDRLHRSLGLETPVTSRRQVEGRCSPGLSAADCTTSTSEPPSIVVAEQKRAGQPAGAPLALQPAADHQLLGVAGC